MATKKFVVIVACGWDRQPETTYDWRALCPTVIQRLETAYKNLCFGDIIGVTGDVPYDAKNNPEATLASCMEAWLRAKGLTNTIIKLQGLNAFSESLLTVAYAKSLEKNSVYKTIVVSSDFYLTAYSRLWKAWARRNEIVLEIISVKSGDWVTKSVWDFYSKPLGQAGLLSRFASLTTVGGHAARFLADSKTLVRKTKGFKLTGCTQIQ